MDDLERDELLSAYVDGELNAGELVQVEQLLAESAEARQIVAELRSLRSTFRRLPQHRLEVDFPQHVLRQAERAMLLGPIVGGADHAVVRHSPGAAPVEKAGVAAPVREEILPLELPRWRKIAAGLGAVAAIAAAVLVMASLTASRGDREIAQSSTAPEVAPSSGRGSDFLAPGLQAGQSYEEAANNEGYKSQERLAGKNRSDGDAYGTSRSEWLEVEPFGESQNGTGSALSRSRAGGMAGAPNAGTTERGRFLKVDSGELDSRGLNLYSDAVVPQNLNSDPTTLSFAGGSATPSADQIVLVKLKRSELESGIIQLEQLLASNNITSTLDSVDDLKQIEPPKQIAATRAPARTQAEEFGASTTMKSAKEPAEGLAAEARWGFTSNFTSQGDVVYWVEAGQEQIQATLDGLKSEPAQFVSVNLYEPENLIREQSQKEHFYRFNAPDEGQATRSPTNLGMRGMSRGEGEAASGALGVERLDVVDPGPSRARYYIRDELKDKGFNQKGASVGGQLSTAVQEEAGEVLNLRNREVRNEPAQSLGADSRGGAPRPSRARQSTTAATPPKPPMTADSQLGDRPAVAAPALAPADAAGGEEARQKRLDNRQGQSVSRNAAPDAAASEVAAPEAAARGGAAGRLLEDQVAEKTEKPDSDGASAQTPTGQERLLIVLQIVDDSDESGADVVTKPAPAAESTSESAPQPAASQPAKK